MFPIGFLAEVVIGFFVEMLGYGIARLVIPIVSFGKIKLDPVSSENDAYNWLGYRYEGDRIVLGPTAAGLIGILIFMAAIVALLFSIIEPQ